MKKTARQLDREIALALVNPQVRVPSRSLPYDGGQIPIDPNPRTIKTFELKKPYVVRHAGRLYTVVLDTVRGYVAHPARVDDQKTTKPTKPSKRRVHATKARKKAEPAAKSPMTGKEAIEAILARVASNQKKHEAPRRIQYTSTMKWHSGTRRGEHIYVVIMRYDSEDDTGVSYVTESVVSESGRPDESWAGGAPSGLSITWISLDEQIAEGKIIPLEGKTR